MTATIRLAPRLSNPLLFGLAISASLVLVAPAAHSQSGGTGTCYRYESETTTTKYYTNAIKVAYTVFGLFGSTESCYEETTKTTKYIYFGPPVMVPASDVPTDPNSLELRMLQGEAKCYGDLVGPNRTSQLGMLNFIGLNGQVTPLSFTRAQGGLSYFLGNGFDTSPFDPAHLQSSTWTGHRAIVSQDLLVQPTLTYAQGGHPIVNVNGMMDVGAPDTKVFDVNLGAAAGGTGLFMLASATAPGHGPLLVVDGVTIPIVADWFTQAFMQAFGPFVGVAAADGTASFSFPQLAGHAFEGLDLNIAVAAMDLSTGQVVAATTFTQLQLRDLGWCP